MNFPSTKSYETFTSTLKMVMEYYVSFPKLQKEGLVQQLIKARHGLS